MSAPSISFAPPPATVLSKQFGQEPTFAFAKLQGAVCLVQLPAQTAADSSDTPQSLDVLVFRHEFVSIFRYSHSARVHPLELRVLESLDDRAIRYEPDNGTVFLARDLMTHLKRILDAAAMFNRTGKRPPRR